jgi:hypothetical protein
VAQDQESGERRCHADRGLVLLSGAWSAVLRQQTFASERLYFC